MELQTQKAKLRTATRGHKLLKDKQDALTKLFLEKVHVVKELREHTEMELKKAYSYFMIARGVMDSATANMVFEASSAEILLKANIKNTLGVLSPEFEFEQKGSLHEYGLVGTSAEVDSALDIFSDVVRGIKGFRTTARDYSASYNGGVKEEGVVMDSGCPTCLVSSQLLPGLLDKDTLIHRSDATQGAWVGSQLQSVLFAWDGCTGRKLQRDLNPN
jgi:hypothetical protein